MRKTEHNRHKELGDFLKARRNKIKPEQVGFAVGTRRRASGLRREEVAQLAGIGLTWYTWLEQGRAINVSHDVLESLSRVYSLTDEERNHLYTLANKSLTNTGEDHQPVNHTLIRILEKLNASCCPAYVMDHRWNIVAWNEYAASVFGDFSQLPPEERNVVHMMFCNQQYMALFDDWAFHAKGIIARFHGTMAKHIDDSWFTGFIEEIKSKNDQFSSWWSLYDVSGMSDVVKKLTHPSFGKLTFEFVSFDVSDHQNLKLLVHTPDDQSLLRMREG